ncbi:hypothetical protein CEXT_354351 [Caerostris extrusa]|uniref:Ycf1 n=1 Tax=Caerostris extrusa TaxID=172846 RepID=A0AAV4Y3Y1_CAEEX|nr:hypothetical protein CEXT_354351 [Caerostris extrusa]
MIILNDAFLDRWPAMGKSNLTPMKKKKKNLFLREFQTENRNAIQLNYMQVIKINKPMNNPWWGFGNSHEGMRNTKTESTRNTENECRSIL